MSEQLPDIAVPNSNSRFPGFGIWFPALAASIRVMGVEILNRAVAAATAAGKAAAAPATGEGGAILYAVVDRDGRRTVLEINGDGDWTPRSYEMMARNPTLVTLLGKSLGLEKLDPTVTDLAMAIVDINGRRTDFELDGGGHITDRVIGLWSQRLGSSGASASTTFPILDWAHWGDSLTEGGWPALLAALTGRNHYNGGRGGQVTSQIAARQGGVPALLTVTGNAIPASGLVTVSAITNNPLSPGDSRPGSLAGIDGVLAMSAGGALTFTRHAPGVDTPSPARTRFTPEDGATRRDRITTIWVGRNDYKQETPEYGVQRVQAMLDYLTPKVQRVMVMEVPPWAGDDEIGTLSRQLLDRHNAAKAASLSPYWLPIATWLRTDAAATAAGIVFTAEDRTDISNGLTPRSLRSDAGHLNAFGNKAVAFRVHQEALNRGWI